MELHERRNGSQMNWREEHTQCLHRKKDGTRCQLDTAPGDYVCGHHTIGLEDIFEDPMAVVAKFRLYFPKNHHPACDRKGQNDCDCPDRTFGELLGLPTSEPQPQACKGQGCTEQWFERKCETGLD